MARIAERAVTLSIDAAEAAELPAYEPGAPEYRANARSGRIGRCSAVAGSADDRMRAGDDWFAAAGRKSLIWRQNG